MKSGREKVVFTLVDGIGGRFWDQISSDQMVAKIAGVAREAGAKEIHSDHRDEYTLRSAFKRHNLRFVSHDWTSGSKIEAGARLRRWLADETLILPPHEAMKREMLSFEEKLSPQSGELTYGARGKTHDDFVALLLTCAMTDLSRRLRPPRPPTEPGASGGSVGQYYDPLAGLVALDAARR